jgi:hypothetical protein
MHGLEISGRFALPPNSLSYCGKPVFRRAFSAYLARKSARNRNALKRELSKFKAHYAYLCLIAMANGLKPFDRQVCEAFWIGNPLLRKVRLRSLRSLILQKFCGPGLLSQAKARRLAHGIPGGSLAHHSFHALYIHTISGAVEHSLRTADLCRVSWGRVVRVAGAQAAVDSQKLERKGGKLSLVPCRKKIRTACEGLRLARKINRGDIVASHWGFAVMKLSKSQMAQLEKCTIATLRALNSA